MCHFVLGEKVRCEDAGGVERSSFIPSHQRLPIAEADRERAYGSDNRHWHSISTRALVESASVPARQTAGHPTWQRAVKLI